MDIAAIKILLATPHPVSGAWNEDDALAADQFNAEDIVHVKASMSGDEVFAATDAGEFSGLTDHKQQLWMAFCGRSNIDPAGASNVALVNWVFGTTSATLTALASARNEMISLATQEGLGFVRTGHVAQAREN